jgi:pentatricopeptide repeat protein
MQVYDDAKLSNIILPVSAYNALMASLQNGGKVSEAMNVWHDMRLQRVLPDSTTYEIVLDGCEQLGLTETIRSVRNQRKADFERLLELDRQKEKRTIRK